MRKLEILSGNDMTTRDITRMNDYFNSYISELITDIDTEAKELKTPLSTVDLGVLYELVNLESIFQTNGVIQYVLDMDSLSQDVKAGLKSGRYKLGESRQVRGNARATIVDTMNHDTRVCDVTVKEVENTPQNSQVISNLMLQMQMKQVTEQINELCDMSRYMIKRHRDRDLKEPFFKARSSITSAQSVLDENEQRRHLQDAGKFLDDVIQAGYQYMETDVQFLEQATHKPFLRYKDKYIRMYMGYICEDIYMVNKSLGLLMLVYKHIEMKEAATTHLLEYVEAMYSFSNKPIGNNKRTAIGVLQDNFPYTKKNQNMWMILSTNIINIHTEIERMDSAHHTYLLSAEA